MSSYNPKTWYVPTFLWVFAAFFFKWKFSNFWAYWSCVHFVKFISKYFIFFRAIINVCFKFWFPLVCQLYIEKGSGNTHPCLVPSLRRKVFCLIINSEIIVASPGSPVYRQPYNAGGVGSIPSWGMEILHASPVKNQNIKQKQYCNKFNKDFLKMVHIEKRKKSDVSFR